MPENLQHESSALEPSMEAYAEPVNPEMDRQHIYRDILHTAATDDFSPDQAIEESVSSISARYADMVLEPRRLYESVAGTYAFHALCSNPDIAPPKDLFTPEPQPQQYMRAIVMPTNVYSVPKAMLQNCWGFTATHEIRDQRVARPMAVAVANKMRSDDPLFALLDANRSPTTEEQVDKSALLAAKAALRASSTAKWSADPETQPRHHPQSREHYRQTAQLEENPPVKRSQTDSSNEQRDHTLELLFFKYFPLYKEQGYQLELRDKAASGGPGLRHPEEPDQWFSIELEHDRAILAKTDQDAAYRSLAIELLLENPDVSLEDNLEKHFRSASDMNWLDGGIYLRGTDQRRALLDAFADRGIFMSLPSYRKEQVGGIATAFAYESREHNLQQTIIEDEPYPNPMPTLKYAINSHVAGRMLIAVPDDKPHPVREHPAPSSRKDTALQAQVGHRDLQYIFAGHDVRIPGYTAINPQGEDGIYAREASIDPYDTSQFAVARGRMERIATQLSEGGASLPARTLFAYMERHDGDVPLDVLAETLRSQTEYAYGYQWATNFDDCDLRELATNQIVGEQGQIVGNCSVSAAILSRCLTLAGYANVSVVSGYLLGSESVSTDMPHVQVTFTDASGARYYLDTTGSSGPDAEAPALTDRDQPDLSRYEAAPLPASPQLASHDLPEITLTPDEHKQVQVLCNSLKADTLTTLDALYTGKDEPLAKALRLGLDPQHNQVIGLYQRSLAWRQRTSSSTIMASLAHTLQLCDIADKIAAGGGTPQQRQSLPTLFGPNAAESGAISAVRSLAQRYQAQFSALGL